MVDAKPTKRPSPARKTGKMKVLAWIGAGAMVFLLAGFLAWKHHFHSYTPIDALKDLEAGAKAGHSPDPVRQFMELRYGPQTDPANRDKAFKDLFNIGHIEGLYLIVGNRTDPQTKARVAELAQIISDYRGMMSPAEKADMGAYFRSPAGHAQIHDATASYQSKDVQFRGVTVPVIQEVLTTLAAVK